MERQELIQLLQGYIGMKPQDVGCQNYNEMQQQLADIILEKFNGDIDKAKKLDTICEFNRVIKDTFK